MIKVLVISHMYPSAFNEVEGIFVHEQVRELIRQGCVVKVVSPVPAVPFIFKYLSNKWLAYTKIPQKATIDSVEVYYPRFTTFPKAILFQYSGYFMYFSIRRLISKIQREFDFDLIHAHVALQDGFAAAILRKRLGKPLVVTIHGKDLYQTINRNRSCKKAIANVFRAAEKIILVSSQLQKIAETNFGSNEKMMVIGNGIPTQKIEKISQKEASTLPNNWFAAPGKVILSASALIPRKAIKYNILAVAKLIEKYPNLCYMIIGDGAEEEHLRALVAQYKLTSNIKFLGRLSHDETLYCMSRSDIFSLPSWNEAFGVVYIEAMAFGKPVIGCLNEGISDVIEHKENGLLVKAKDVHDLVEAIDFLLNNPNETRKIGMKARKTVYENFTWEINAQKNIEVYKEITHK